MKISRLIFFSFLFVLALFSITTFINYKLSKQVTNNTEYFAKSTTIIRNSTRFQRNILNMVSGLRGYLLTGEDYFMQVYDSATKENESILAELIQLIPDNPQEEKLLNDIQALNAQWVNYFATPLIAAKKISVGSETDQKAFNNLYREKRIQEDEQGLQTRLQEKFRQFSNFEYKDRDLRKKILDQSIENTRRTSLYLTLLSVFAGLMVAAFLAHRISSRIVKMVDMSHAIASGNYNVHTDSGGKDELSRLANALNHMSRVLSENITLLKRKNDELDQFAHVVSHDLKAPLRGIDNVLNWIEEDLHQEISPKMQEYLNLIKGRVSRSENLISGILSYAKVGKEKPQAEKVDVNKLVEEVWETVSNPGLSLFIPSPLPVVQTEKVPLTQVITNLLSNAVKYNDKVQGEVTVYHTDKGDHYLFHVQDNGPGIAKNYHNKIFVIFQTLKERDSFESTGVGLAIVKKILDTRGEKISLDSGPGQGATFSFTWSKKD